MHRFIGKDSLLRTLLWGLVATFFLISQYRGLGSQFVEIFPDSNRYFPPTPVLSLENAGFFYSFFARATDHFPGVIDAQVALSSFSWIFLSFALLMFFSSWVGLVASISIIFIAAQEAVTSWNNLLLSESVAISAFAIWLAAFILLMKQPKSSSIYWVILITLIFFSLVLVMNRPQAIIVILPSCLFLLLTSTSQPSRFGVVVFISGLLLTTFTSLWRLIALAFGSPFSSAYGQHLIENREAFTFFALEKAGCDPKLGIFEKTYSTLVEACPNLAALNEDRKISFVSWLLSKPIEALFSFTNWVGNGATFVSYSSSPTLIEEGTANQLLGLGIPLLKSMSMFCVGSIFLIIISGLIYGFSFSLKRLIISVCFVISMFLYVFIAWGVDGIELSRHSLPVLLFIPIAIAISVLFMFKQDRQLRAINLPTMSNPRIK